VDDPLDVLIDVEDRLQRVKLAAIHGYPPSRRRHRQRDRVLLATGSACAAALVVYWRVRSRSAPGRQ
jgi:hypothetical protein